MKSKKIQKRWIISILFGILLVVIGVIAWGVRVTNPTKQDLLSHPEAVLAYPGAINEGTEFTPKHGDPGGLDQAPQMVGAVITTGFHVPSSITRDAIDQWYDQWLKQHHWVYDNEYDGRDGTFEEIRYRYTRNQLKESFDLIFDETLPTYGLNSFTPTPPPQQKEREFSVSYTIAP